ncbi:MAG: hypothetical protein JWR37_6236, partial [Mycobacterium sp.]|nr:hypothetical protein [Mycobacterium sp.]
IERTEVSLPTDATHGFVLDERGVSAGWTDRGQGVVPNPARTVRPVTEEHAAQQIVSVADLALLAGVPEQPKRIAVVAGPSSGRSLAAEAMVTQLKSDRPGLVVEEITESPGTLLNRPDLPSEGYVANIAGRVVWGWRPGAVRDWPVGDDSSALESAKGALVDLMKQAGRTGLQLVVQPEGPVVVRLRGAVAGLAEQSMPQRLASQGRFAQAMENHGAGLEDLTVDDLLAMLVSDRAVRIVDGDGTVLRDLNDRSVYRPGRAAEQVAGQFVVRRVQPPAVDTSIPVGEEYALRGDGTLSRSVAWKQGPGGLVTLTGHVRRAIHDADPVSETPELAARLGLGSAVTKELPGAERIQQEAMAILLGLVNARYGVVRHQDLAAGSGGDSVLAATRDMDGMATRFSRLASRHRFTAAKQLQIQFSVPKIRAARDRGFDAGLREKVIVGGRAYLVSVQQVMVNRDHDEGVATERDVAIDHQVKGMRSGGQTVTRGWSITSELGAAVHVETEAMGNASVELGDFGTSLRYSRDHLVATSSVTKGYSRLRAGKGEVSRPVYEARYQVTVTETRPRFLGQSASRTVSRIVGGDEVRLPAIVHPGFRPDAATAATPEFRTAFRDIASTAGRTTVLSADEFTDLEHHPRLIDFTASGMDGLHTTFSGLGETVKYVSKLVAAHIAGGNIEDDGLDAEYTNGPDPEYIAEVEKALTEGGFRSNPERFFGRTGVPIPLPKEYHFNPVRPHIDGAVTVRGFLIRADDAAAFQGPKATIESYSEVDTKITRKRSSSWSAGVHGSVGPNYRFGTTTASENSGGRANSRRSLFPSVGVGVDGEANWILRGRETARTSGSIDVSLLTEGGIQHFSRAHLVLEVLSTRQAVDARTLGTALDVITRDDATTRASERRLRVLVENSAELSMSTTLHTDVGHSADPHYLEPSTTKPASRHIARDNAALAAGYVTYFDDQKVTFEGTTAAGATFQVDKGEGVIGAVRAGIVESGLVDPQYLNDASDIWRSLT